MAWKTTYTTETAPWSDKRFNTAPAPIGAPKSNNVWNMRFDWMPSQSGRTYDGKKMPAIGPAPMNKAKS